MFPDEIDDLLRYNLSTTLYTRDIAESLSQAAVRMNQAAEVHIKVDTGMGRLGVGLEDLPAFSVTQTGSLGKRTHLQNPGFPMHDRQQWRG